MRLFGQVLRSRPAGFASPILEKSHDVASIGPRLRAVTCLATTSRNLTPPIIILAFAK